MNKKAKKDFIKKFVFFVENKLYKKPIKLSQDDIRFHIVLKHYHLVKNKKKKYDEIFVLLNNKYVLKEKDLNEPLVDIVQKFKEKIKDIKILLIEDSNNPDSTIYIDWFCI